MKYGICNLGIVPVRAEKADVSEMVTQLLYGELFKVVDPQKKWSKIKLAFDGYEGWIDNKQFVEITEDHYKLLAKEIVTTSADLVNFITTQEKQLITIPLGSDLSSLSHLGHSFDGAIQSKKISKESLVNSALLYLNTPYLWGGKTPFGIDCSGFTQMVYKLNGHRILRDASQQATQGEALSFIEESEPGDLAFFDNAEGAIIHVGLIMADHHIIHAHGKVRIDRIDHTGIFNNEKKAYTHKLRVIKKII